MACIRIVRLTLILLLVAGVAGCSPATETVPGWPASDSERTVPKPAEPIRWPLTGLDAPSAEAIRQRVVSVKIENSPAARPQSGLQQADVVYETVAEGGITRFNAMFHSQVPDPVGPVRSARLSDITIVPQYGALFVFSGASASVNSAVRSAGLENLSQDAGVTAPFFRSSARSAPHNLYAHLDTVRSVAVRRGLGGEADPTRLMFVTGSSTTTAGVSALSIDIPFSTANRVLWNYDATADAYLRTNNGRAHTDALTGEQIAARNVVVMWAQYVPQGKRDSAGSTTYDVTLKGTGKAAVFISGRRLDATWEADGSAPPTFKAADGTPIKLARGNTWFQVIDSGISITSQ